MKALKNKITKTHFERIKSIKLLSLIKSLNMKNLILYPKKALLFACIYYLRKIINTLQALGIFKNEKIRLELRLIMQNYLLLVKEQNLINFRVLTKKTLCFLANHIYLKKNKNVCFFFDKMLNLFIKQGYNLYSSKNIEHLKKIRISENVNTTGNAGLNKKMFKKFVGMLTKKGQKIKAKSIFTDALIKVRKEIDLPINLILLKMFTFLKTSVESKKIRVRRTFHTVPFPINENRKTFLVIKWILSSLKKSQNVSNSLASEIIKILKNFKSNAIKYKNYNVALSLKNKSNSHFRW